MLPPVYFEVQLAAHEIKLLCSHQSGNYLARDWRIEGWGIGLISGAGICLNVWPLPPNSWIKHWLGIDSRQSSNRRPLAHLFPQWIHAVFQKNTNQSDCLPTKWCYQRMRTMQELKGTGRNCCLWFFSMKNRVKQNDCNGTSAVSPAFSFRWKTHTCFITNTHIRLQSPTVYQTFLRFAVISFTWFSSLAFLLLHLSACRGNENRGGARRLNCSLFMPSSRVNMEPSSVNWIVQLVVTGSSHGDVGYRWDTAQSHTCSCHIFLPFKRKHPSSKQS